MTTKRIVLAFLLAGIIALSNLAVAAQEQEPTAQSKAQKQACSEKILNGAYGYQGGGKMGDVSFFSIGTATFDGEGNFTWTSSDFPGLMLTGTYTVAADCTGTTVHNFIEGIPPGNGKLVIVDNGKEFYIVPDPPGPFLPSTSVFIYKRQ